MESKIFIVGLSILFIALTYANTIHTKKVNFSQKFLNTFNKDQKINDKLSYFISELHKVAEQCLDNNNYISLIEQTIKRKKNDISVDCLVEFHKFIRKQRDALLKNVTHLEETNTSVYEHLTQDLKNLRCFQGEILIENNLDVSAITKGLMKFPAKLNDYIEAVLKSDYLEKIDDIIESKFDEILSCITNKTQITKI